MVTRSLESQQTFIRCRVPGGAASAATFADDSISWKASLPANHWTRKHWCVAHFLQTTIRSSTAKREKDILMSLSLTAQLNKRPLQRSDVSFPPLIEGFFKICMHAVSWRIRLRRVIKLFNCLTIEAKFQTPGRQKHTFANKHKWRFDSFDSIKGKKERTWGKIWLIKLMSKTNKGLWEPKTESWRWQMNKWKHLRSVGL